MLSNPIRTPTPILSTLQEGRAHAIGTAEGVVETFIAAALRVVRADEPAPELPVAEWMATRLDHAQNLLTAAVTDERNEDLPDIAERAAKVREALEAGAHAWRQQERQSTIETPLAAEKVAAFREQTRASLSTARIVPDLLRLAGAVTELNDPPDDRQVVQWQQHKGFFTKDSRYVGVEMIARDIGHEVAHSELRTLIQPMTNTDSQLLVTGEPDVENASEFVEQLRSLVDRTVQAATPPTAVVLLLPIQWQLTEALGLSFLGGGVAPPDVWGLSEGATHNFAGMFEGAASYTFPEVPDDVLYVVNLAQYVTAEVWQPSNEQAVTVNAFTEEEARSRAQRDPGREEIGEDEIVRRWREMALITVDPCLRLQEDRDSTALTAIRLPTSLTQDTG